MVVEDPEILSGTPVIKGTRVPVYDIAAAIDSGTAIDRILKSYPSLKDWQVELASAYAKQFLGADAQSEETASESVDPCQCRAQTLIAPAKANAAPNGTILGRTR